MGHEARQLENKKRAIEGLMYLSECKCTNLYWTFWVIPNPRYKCFYFTNTFRKYDTQMDPREQRLRFAESSPSSSYASRDVCILPMSKSLTKYISKLSVRSLSSCCGALLKYNTIITDEILYLSGRNIQQLVPELALMFRIRYLIARYCTSNACCFHYFFVVSQSFN